MDPANLSTSSSSWNSDPGRARPPGERPEQVGNMAPGFAVKLTYFIKAWDGVFNLLLKKNLGQLPFQDFPWVF